MYLHLVLVNDIGVEFEWRHLKREGLTIVQRIPLTEYMMPRPATFNLLNENEVHELMNENCHRKSLIYLNIFRRSRQNSQLQWHTGSQKSILHF